MKISRNQKIWISVVLGILILIGVYLYYKNRNAPQAVSVSLSDIEKRFPTQTEYIKFIEGLPDDLDGQMKALYNLLQAQYNDLAEVVEVIKSSDKDKWNTVKLELNNAMNNIRDVLSDTEANVQSMVSAVLTQAELEGILSELKTITDSIGGYKPFMMRKLPIDNGPIEVKNIVPGQVLYLEPLSFSDRYRSHESPMVVYNPDYTFVIDEVRFRIGDWFVYDGVQRFDVDGTYSICTSKDCNVVINSQKSYGNRDDIERIVPIKFVFVGMEDVDGQTIRYFDTYKWT